MKAHTILLDALKTSKRIELVGDYMHVHPVEYYRPHGTDALYAQINDSTFTSGKYSKVMLNIYGEAGRFESEVKVANVPGVICLLHLTGIKLEKIELRQIKRVEAVREIEIIMNNKEREVLLKNISLGGICFQSEQPMVAKNGKLHLVTLKNESMNIPFEILHERYNEEKVNFTYHCRFNDYTRRMESILEKEIVGLQLKQIRGEKVSC